MGIDRIFRLRLYIHHAEYPERYIPTRKLPQIRLKKGRGEGANTTTTVTAPTARLAHRYIILTTVESYYSHVRDYCGARRPRTSRSAQARDKDYTDGIAWARILRDEAHLTTNWSTTVYQILQALADNSWVLPNFLALTATPMLRNGVCDILALVRTINLFSPDIGRRPDCAEFATSRKLMDLAAAYTSTRRDQVYRPQPNTESHDPLTEVIGRL